MTAASLFLSIIVFAISSGSDEQSQQYHYAEHLFESGDYQAARLEYKRLLFYRPDPEFRDVADYRIAQSYYYQNRPERAEHLFREFLTVHPNSSFRFRSQLMIGQLHFDARKYSLARTTLFELLQSSEDTEAVAAAHYLRGWCYVHTADWNKAIAELRRVNTLQMDTSHGKNARRLADMLLEKTPLPHKSPQMAGWLSTVIPGSGQLYVGRVKEGVLAAVLSGAFIYLVADAIRERRYVDGAGISLIGWQFYWGNRIEAQRFASEYNSHRESELIEALKKSSGR
ncbi:MAG: tetratricopeptide repeat protein [Candidatus Poribacteria bacterium]|nr:tetratricopeptide repeat protein [Candidatus Poribacteria bacterium]